MGLSREQALLEYAKCIKDTPYALKTYLQTYDNTQSQYVPLELFSDQKTLINDYDTYEENIALKYRQAGVSTVTAAWASKKVVTASKRKPEKVLIIANKMDTLSNSETRLLEEQIDHLILLSAKNNIGTETLKTELTSLVNIGALSNNETIVTNSRHFEALNNALTAILSVQQGIDLEISTDLFSIDIRECLRHLGNITGEYDVDKDILGHIFSNFCIGK